METNWPSMWKPYSTNSPDQSFAHCTLNKLFIAIKQNSLEKYFFKANPVIMSGSTSLTKLAHAVNISSSFM